jgi:acyl-CoA synthetase (AMP-forming)/AMP-acid ligase II
MLDNSANLSDVLRATASACGGKPAIVDEHGTLTYRELDRQVDALASFVHRIGIRPGESIAYLLWNQRELLISYHGITRIGAVIVSLNYRLSGAELAHQLNASKARAIIYDESLLQVVDQALALADHELLRIQVGGTASSPGAYGFGEALSEPVAPSLFNELTISSDDVSGIWFTSGTEGRPKGAVVRHRSAIAAAHASALAIGIRRDTRCLAVAPLFHRGAAENVALAVTLVGGTHYLEPRFSAAGTLDALARHKINTAFIVPTMARMLVQDLKGQTRELPHLENWVSASAPMPPALEAEVRRTFKLKAGIINCYGITEMLLITLGRTSESEAYDGTAGTPIPTVQVRIHDDARGVLPAGETGEILARGPLAFSHYLDDPVATEAARIRVDGMDWYRTGDIGQLDESGSLMILDRRKDMILSGGENIYSAEVEAALILHPQVAEVAVVGQKDDQWGEIVVAFVVARGAEGPTLSSIRAACGSLATYKHPKEIVCVPALPKNSFGKVQKHVLKQQLPNGFHGSRKTTE